MSTRGYPYLRLATSDGVPVLDRYKSGRSISRGRPDCSSRSTTRSAGTPAVFHLWTACGEIPKALAKAPTPPDNLMAFSTTDLLIRPSQPQVEALVNLQLLAGLNRRFHACGMSPLGKTITVRLRALKKTQAWLAEQVGVSENAVSKWIKTGEIKLDNAITVAEVLQIGIAQLVNENPTPELDERWHSFPSSLKQRVLALVDELTQSSEPKPKRRA